ncbi:hypothetical protein ACFYTQ_18350 [Nocardia sp. NPDC004068]|uniref:hypothetical protein n=1 Tax=Nocardia sp. NPDC004068 TaxID=3364303 RepID=UPI0036B4EF2B
MGVTRRISVVGTSGSGKSTLARRISERLGVAYVELDAIHHQADWQPLSESEFRAVVAERLAVGGWVADGNYRGKLGDLVWRQADTVVWFDLPLALVMTQVVRRTLLRLVLRRELWNGNRERWRDLLSRDPQRSIIMWAYRSHATNRARFLAAERDPAFAHLTFVRVRSHREADAFVASLPVSKP